MTSKTLPPERPAQASSTLVRHDDGIEIRVPRAIPVSKAGCISYGLLAMTAALLLVCVIVYREFALELEPANLGIALALVGAGWVVYLRYATRLVARLWSRAVVEVHDDELYVETRSPFGRAENFWHTDELASIGVESSDIELNEAPFMELSITPESGDPTRLLTHLHEAELEWIAHELREALRLGE